MCEDKIVVQCNHLEGVPECAAGARAYVIKADMVSRRVYLLARSRSGRWIGKWENVRRLTRFRYKSLPAESPLYERLESTTIAPEALQELNGEN